MTHSDQRVEMIQSLMGIAYAFLDAGHIFITAIRELTELDRQHLEALAAPYEVEVHEI